MQFGGFFSGVWNLPFLPFLPKGWKPIFDLDESVRPFTYPAA